MTGWVETYQLVRFRRCWDLVRQVFADRAGIELPAHTAVRPGRLRAVTATMSGESSDRPWLPISIGDEATLDVLLIDDVLAGRLMPLHVGVVTGPGHVLHLSRGAGVVHLPFRDGSTFRAHPSLRGRIAGIYRHEALA